MHGWLFSAQHGFWARKMTQRESIAQRSQRPQRGISGERMDGCLVHSMASGRER